MRDQDSMSYRVKSDTFATLGTGTMIFCDHRISQQIAEFVCKFWPKLGCVIIIIPPDICES